MAATKTHAFVLKTQDYRDTSLLLTVYTQDHGKIRGIVKGVRDTRAKYGSTFEPFSLNEILFYKRRKGGDLHQITHADTVDMFYEVREDLEKLAYACYFVELIDELVETEEAHPEIFTLLHESILFLNSGASVKRAARIFEVKLLELLGLVPEIQACAICQTLMPEPAFFNPSSGGILCRNCAGKSQGIKIPVSKGTLNFLAHVRRSEIRSLYSVKVAQEVGEELEKILRRFVDFHLHYPLKSLQFMEKMNA